MLLEKFHQKLLLIFFSLNYKILHFYTYHVRRKKKENPLVKQSNFKQIQRQPRIVVSESVGRMCNRKRGRH
jgi:hypothetical protein